MKKSLYKRVKEELLVMTLNNILVYLIAIQVNLMDYVLSKKLFITFGIRYSLFYRNIYKNL